MIQHLTQQIFILITLTGSILGFVLPQDSYAQCVDTYPYVEDFESGAGGWSSASVQGGVDTWGLGDPTNKEVIDTAFSGTQCWYTGSRAALNYKYSDREHSAVVSPCFDFTNLQNPGIQVAIWWESPFREDGCVLQGRINGGAWQPVGIFTPANLDNWYNSDSLLSSPGNVNFGWSGRDTNSTSPGEWVIAQNSLADFAGADNVEFRFVFRAQLNPQQFDGFAFDDVLIADRPTLALGPDTVICTGDSVEFNAGVIGGVSYQWNTSVLDTLPIRKAALSGVYSVEVIDTLNFILRDTVVLTVSSTFANLGADQGICLGDTLALDAGNPGRTFSWQPFGQTSQSIDVTREATYTVTIRDNFGCVEVDSIRIFVDSVPEVNLGPDTNLCAGDLVILDAGEGNPGTTYAWSPVSANTRTIQVGAPAQYKVVVTTLFGCTDSDSVEVGVRFKPTLNLGPDTVVCDSYLLDARNPGADFLWSTNDTTQTIAPTQGGTYWVRVANELGCVNSDTIVLRNGSIPSVSLGPDRIVCGGNNVVLSAQQTAERYQWSNGATTSFIQVTLPGEYILNVFSADGCKASDTVEVQSSTLNVDLGPDQTICVGDTAILDAGPLPDFYQWSNNETTQTISVTLPGTFVVTVLDSVGCELKDTVIVSDLDAPVPVFTFTGNRIIGNPVQFNGGSTGSIISWQWDFGDGRTSAEQNPVHTFESVTTFDVCLTVDNGTCERTTCQSLRVGLVSIEEAFPGQVQVYPNPTSGPLTLDLDLLSPGQTAYQLLDLQGRTVRQASLGLVGRATHDIGVQGLPAGLYLLKLTIAGQIAVAKIWIQ